MDKTTAELQHEIELLKIKLDGAEEKNKLYKANSDYWRDLYKAELDKEVKRIETELTKLIADNKQSIQYLRVINNN